MQKLFNIFARNIIMDEINHNLCLCGNTISNDDISFSGGNSDTGEEFCIITYMCDNCGIEVEYSTWGEYDYENRQEYMEEIVDRLKDLE